MFFFSSSVFVFHISVVNYETARGRGFDRLIQLLQRIFFFFRKLTFTHVKVSNSTALFQPFLFLTHSLQKGPDFYVSAVYVSKTMWEKEKLLVTSNFSFFSQCFLSFFEEIPAIFIKLKIVVCKLIQFGRVYRVNPL